MINIIFTILAIIPVILICHFVYVKDKRKEPKKLLAKLFGFGFLSAALTIIITIILQKLIPFFAVETSTYSNNYIAMFFYIFIGVALIEEFSKFILTYWGAYNNENFDELYDGIVYCVYVSIGFACIENILYVSNYANIGVLSGLSTAIIRGIMAVPGHAFDAVFMGHFFGMAKYYQKKNNKSLEKKNLLYAVLVPTLIHGLYDYGLLINNFSFVLLVVGLVIFLYIFCIKKVIKVSGENKVLLKSNFCPTCGSKVESSFCPKCGTKQN